MKMPTTKRIALAVVLAAGFAGTANAAGPAPEWTGFYVGANAGGAWTDAKFGMATPSSPNPPAFFPNDAAAIAVNGSGSFNSTDFTFGAQAGYNYRFHDGLVGAEIDWGRLNANESQILTAPTPGAGNQTTATTFKTGSLATLRARLGYIFEQRTLLYLTAGAAYSKVTLDQSTTFSGVPTVDLASISDNKWGWTVGGGVEYAFDANWRLKAEYLYVDLGSVSGSSLATSPFGAPATIPFTHNAGTVKSSIGRIGVNYRF